MIKNLIYLVIAAVIAAALISFAEQSTRVQRNNNQNVYATRMLSEVLPIGQYDLPPGSKKIMLQDAELLGSKKPLPAYPVSRDGAVVAIVISAVAPDGYVGAIPLIVGITRDGKVAAVRATGHRETPGLGDKIDVDKSDWIRQFTNKSLVPTNQWALQSDGGQFDHISGATITSRAVTQAVRNALTYYSTNEAELIDSAAN